MTNQDTCFTIRQATVDEAPDVAGMVGELLTEIMAAIGVPAFHFDLAETTARLGTFLDRETYFVFVAGDETGKLIGLVTMYESHALYAEGSFGTIPELYVRPGHRSEGIGGSLLANAKRFAASRRWTRLEVTTPPLPQFDATLKFYEREGFAITGGSKLKCTI